MSYIGQQLPADVFSGFTIDKFTGDGTANKALTLSKAPFSETTVLVTIDGVVQEPTDDFTVSGTTLTLVGTAANGSEINVTHLSGTVPSTLASKVDLNGVSDTLILDADGDTTISADTDDQIDVKIGGTDALRVTGTALTGNALATIGAAGTASTVAGIPFYTADSSIYTHDVSGTDDTAESNTAYGISALDAITTGDSNVAIGAQAGTDMNTGNKNVMIGKNAFFNATSAAENVVIGFLAGGAGTATSGYNVIIGNEAAEEVSSMSESTVVGYKAATSNTTGSHILAMGYTAYDGADTENHNLAIGTSALGGSVAGGEYNVAVGNYSLGATTSGDNNTGVGYQALGTHSSGTSNTAMGYQAMSAGNITGNYNTAIGVQASNNATSGQNNTTLGYSAGNDSMYSLTNESHKIAIGNNNNTDAYIKIDWTVTSDARDKMNFGDVPHGLDFINQLTPIKFHFKKSRDDETPHGRARYGFKAQDILALEGDDPVIIDAENLEALKYKGEHLVPVLVNAVKELSAKVKALEEA